MKEAELIEYIESRLDDSVTAIDIIIDLCEKKQIEIELIASMIKGNKLLFERVKDDAILLRMIKKDQSNTLMEFI